MEHLPAPSSVPLRVTSGGRNAVTLGRIKPLCLALLTASVLSACGGGGGGGNDDAGQAGTGGGAAGGSGGSGEVPTQPAPSPSALVMSCPEGGNYQCSGRTLIQEDNGIALTSSGVQAYGRSTYDKPLSIADPTRATGFEPARGGLAEIRVAKNADAATTGMALLLSNFNMSWDGKQDRPPIIETFNPARGRNELAADGRITDVALPAETDLGFFDYGTKLEAGTQLHYANNRYFPRTDPSRCNPAPVPPATCPTTETSGLQLMTRDWRSGGIEPDIASAIRVHGDGDVHAGNGPAGSGGSPTYITGGTGPGVPFPGSKGYRSLDNWGLRYANLATWVTQDTILIEEWAHLGQERNTARRGLVAYGDVTNPAQVPSSGEASYRGIAYGWYAPNADVDPTPFRGNATVQVNFATRKATIQVRNAIANDKENGESIPVNIDASADFGAAGSDTSNYMTAPLSHESLRGGISGRYFGPVSNGGSGAGPAEAAGAFQLTNSGSGVLAVGGFIAQKQ